LNDQIEGTPEGAPSHLHPQRHRRRRILFHEAGGGARRKGEKLRRFRDTLAHGKPEELKQEVVATAEELAARGILPAEWEAFIDDPGFFRDAYGDVEQIWQELLTRSGLTVVDTLSHGGGETSFMEHVEEGA
jgi:hypothetical protein